jgi:hypothetical protein
MIIAKIKKLDGTYLDHGNFQSEEAAMEWFQPLIDKGVYGQKHVPAHEVPAVLNLDGAEVTPAYVAEEIPADFSVEFEEWSKPQSEINSEAEAYLSSTDWYVVRFAETAEPIPSEISSARAAARASIVR